MNIFIMGGMGSGKSTVAEHLCKHIQGAKKLTLAYTLKNIVKEIDIKSDDELIDTYISPYVHTNDDKRDVWKQIFEDTRKIPTDGEKDRKRLQFLGTDGARVRVSNNIWINIVIKKASKEPNTVWIVDDCRFKNEANTFFAEGWIPIFLFIEPKTQVDRLSDLYKNFDILQLEHQSEKELRDILVPTKSIFVSHPNIDHTLSNIKDYIWKELALV